MVEKYECLGCEENCKTTSAIKLTGCFYEDGDYPKDADIWIEEWMPEKLKEGKRQRVKKLKIKGA